MTAALQRDLELPPKQRWKKGERPTQAYVLELERQLGLTMIAYDEARDMVGRLDTKCERLEAEVRRLRALIAERG